MARQSLVSPQFSFTKGLVTEVTELSYPENSAKILKNLDIGVDGAVRRRFGLRRDKDGEALDMGNFPPFVGNSTVISAHLWEAPGGQRDFDLVVIQVGDVLVYRRLDSGSISDRANTQLILSDTEDTINPINYGYPGSPSSSDIASSRFSSTQGQGSLWLTHPYTFPLQLSYNKDTGAIDIRSIVPYVRDFAGVSPREFEHNTELTRYEFYNLLNQGWTVENIEKHKSGSGGSGDYPNYREQWFQGKNSTGFLEAQVLHKLDLGNSPAPRGRGIMPALGYDRASFTLDADFTTYEEDRTTVDTVYVTGQSFTVAREPTASAGSSFTTCAFHQGRLWLSGDTTEDARGAVYFSKSITNPDDAEQFYQTNDPTVEILNEALDTDGGVITIPGSGQILHLEEHQAGVLVFATGGVWYIRGGEAGFTPLSFTVDKISSSRTVSPDAVVSAESGIVWWSDEGILTVDDEMRVKNVSEHIKSYLASLGYDDQEDVVGVYDAINKKIVWQFRGTVPQETTREVNWLILDTRTSAFSTYRFSLSDTNQGNIEALFPFRRSIPAVYVELDGTQTVLDENIRLQVAAITKNTVSGEIHIGLLADATFRDFRDIRSSWTPFGSALEIGAQSYGDMGRNKQAPYVHTFFEATEEEVVDVNGVDTVLGRESGCIATFKWGWYTKSLSDKWTSPQQAYRRRGPALVAGNGYDNGEGIVYTKLKARGRGKALAIRYESQDGKDFRLVGYNVLVGMSSNV